MYSRATCSRCSPIGCSASYNMKSSPCCSVANLLFVHTYFNIMRRFALLRAGNRHFIIYCGRLYAPFTHAFAADYAPFIRISAVMVYINIVGWHTFAWCSKMQLVPGHALIWDSRLSQCKSGAGAAVTWTVSWSISFWCGRIYRHADMSISVQ